MVLVVPQTEEMAAGERGDGATIADELDAKWPTVARVVAIPFIGEED